MPRTIVLLSVLLTACAGVHDDDPPAADSGAKPSIKDNPPCRGTRQPTYHRPTGMTCTRDRPPSPERDTPPRGCQNDAECTDGENGRCGPNNRGLSMCNYDECFSDAECNKGGPCACRTRDFENHRCMPGNCQTNADCGANRACSPSFGPCGNYTGVVGYYCHTCIDECVDDSECGANGYCAYEPALGVWKCSSSHCLG